jgi:hypothetical protein
MRKGNLLNMFALAVVFIAALSVAGYSEIDLWSGVLTTGTATIAAGINSWNLLTNQNYQTSPYEFINIGLISNVDAIYVGSLSEAIFRWDATGGNNLAILDIGVTPTTINPEYDLSISAGNFSLVGNLVASVPFAAATNTTITLGLAPSWTVNKLIDFYAELIPSYALNTSSPFNFNAALGVDFTFNSNFGLSFGPYISDINSKTPGLDIESQFWYTFTAK